MTSRLRALGEAGQAIWLDFLDRRILEDGTLRRLIADDGITGLTSNPAIFEKAIGEGGAYDDRLAGLVAAGDASPGELYERLAIADIQAAADLFRPTWDALGGADGYVSLEVSPYLAMDTEGTIAEGLRLWQAVARPNLMIKVPGTAPGVAAIRALIAAGVNVNVTLLFGIEAYLAVADAHMAGLEDRLGAGKEIAGVHGVASFFVSRIDGVIDRKIDARLAGASAAPEGAALEGLRGKVAIANAKVAYQRYLELIGAPRWKALSAAGATPQRLLWASTGTKDPAYSDVLYVETLIGADTINTMPPKTMDAFRDHGVASPSLTADVAGAHAILEGADRLGLDLEGVTAGLVSDGVAQFAAAFDALLGAVADKRIGVLGAKLDGQEFSLPPALAAALDARLDHATREGWARRLWAGDASLWTGGDEGEWLGWLAAARGGSVDLAALDDLTAEVKSAGYGHAVLIGMGGSSLAPEVLAKVFGPADGHPPLIVLDSTDPEQIARVERQIDLARTLFIVSSKSGTTLESQLLGRYFFSRVQSVPGAGAGARFIAITDPGSALEREARARGFAHVFPGEPTIGGRYSAFSNFGMAPAAVLGLDLRGAFGVAARMVNACAASAPPRANPGLRLGALLGEAARAGCDKLTLIASPAIAPFGAWLEQLIAESTGKHGGGIIPVDGEPLGAPEVYGGDRLFVRLALEGEPDDTSEALQALERAGRPVVRITLASPAMLAQEIVRWEIAVAVAGAVLGIDPFDQPDVEASKVRARALTDAYEATGALAAPAPNLCQDGLSLYAPDAGRLGQDPTLEAWLAAFFGRAKAGGYIGLLAYLDHDERHVATLARVRTRLRDHLRVATVVGFGPRFQHSTGQAYKGGPAGGVFLQITGKAKTDIEVPGRRLSFAVVERAQALGDLEVLAERGRAVLSLDLGTDIEGGLERLARAVDETFQAPR